MLAEDIQQSLKDAGALALGPVPSVEEALELLDRETEVGVAVLDINLNSEKVFPDADALAARGVRFLFATGYDACNVPPAYRNVTRCEKPVDTGTIARALGS